MTTNKKALLLIGSPKGEKSTSASLGNYLTSKLEEFGMISEIGFIHRLVNREEKIQSLFEMIDTADLIILSFPLYVDSLPAPVIKAMELIKPKLKAGGAGKPMGTILIGSVEGDVHSIGKNLMIALLEGQGFEVVDLGTDVSSEKFVEEAKKLNPVIIGMSGLITTSISAMQKTVLMLKEENIQSKIIIGGGLLTKESSEMVGADDFAVDGWEGLKKIKKILEGVE